MMKKIFDVIVVGSGPSGAIAAETLVLSGVTVCMLDGGITDDTYTTSIPNKSFTEIRESEGSQHEYFLGKDLEGIQFEEIKGGAQLTPPRQYVTRDVDTLIPSASQDFSRVESLARGGLGGAWGLGVFALTDKEICAIGLKPKELRKAYRTIASRIGISAANDDGAPFCLSGIDAVLPATRMETSTAKLYNGYLKKRTQLNARGLFMGRTPLALLTEPLGERKATRYNDMDFWTNEGNSAYRPNVTLDELKEKNNFIYHGGYLVTKFLEKEGVVIISALNISTKEASEFFCKKLILCAGIFGTARIVLRSSPSRSQKLPIVCGSYVYYPCIQPRTFGIGTEKHKTSYSQLALFYDRDEETLNTATVQFYTYSSLMLHRLAPELPINFGDSLKLLRLGAPNLVIAGLHQSGTRSKNRYVELAEDNKSITGDKLVIHYEESETEKRVYKKTEGIIRRALRNMGCYPIRRIDPGHGGSIHYGGALPYDESGKPFTLSSQGKLSNSQNIFVADGSGWNYMPPKGPTFTLMANAHNIALHVITTLKK